MNYFLLILTVVVLFNDINNITGCQGNIILVFLLVVSCHYVLHAQTSLVPTSRSPHHLQYKHEHFIMTNYFDQYLLLKHRLL